MDDGNEEVHVNTDRARGGATPHMTRYILAISLALIIVIFAVIVWSGT
ncbi:hypothetical protein KY084_02255 [Stakelama sp. CBK3Z-3]|uniref:Aa3-type cytochrome c oxidase subunit IV n=1 Tax=Stakelama flava TaxID=2860338 RepID=A0ABS6XHP2_9SPHN|nr:hypothetical protein [Stakelama flava]MBW4329697.1 hypothetical protein [Stakelama flava]